MIDWLHPAAYFFGLIAGLICFLLCRIVHQLAYHRGWETGWDDGFESGQLYERNHLASIGGTRSSRPD